MGSGRLFHKEGPMYDKVFKGQLLLTNLKVIAFIHQRTLSLVGNQFIDLNFIRDISAFYLRQNRIPLFCIICIFFFVFWYDLGTKLGTRSQNMTE